MAPAHGDPLSSPGIPDGDHAVVPAARHPRAVGTQSHRVKGRVQINGPAGPLLTGRRVIDDKAQLVLLVRQHGRQACPVRAKGDMEEAPPRLDVVQHVPGFVPQCHVGRAFPGRKLPPVGRRRGGEHLNMRRKRILRRLVTAFVREAETAVGEGPHAQSLQAGEQDGGGAGVQTEHGGAVVEPAVQVVPLPAAQLLRRLLQVTGRVGDVVAGQGGDRRRQPRLVRLRPGQPGAPVCVAGGDQGDDRSGEQRYEDDRGTGHQPLVAAHKAAGPVDGRRRPRRIGWFARWRRRSSPNSPADA